VFGKYDEKKEYFVSGFFCYSYTGGICLDSWKIQWKQYCWKAGEKPSYDFYFLIAAIILVVAVSTYIYSIRKFGPA